MKRKGSSKLQFVQRIPLDVKSALLGKTLFVPVGPKTVEWRASPSTQAVRLSLGTTDSREAKARAAVIRGYLETTWQALRNGDQPVALTHAQALALAKRLYESWAEERPTERDLVAEYNRETGKMEIVPPTYNPDPDMWANIAETFEKLRVDPVAPMKAIVARLAREKRIGALTEDSQHLVAAALADLGKAAALNRQRQYAGDYSPDPKPAQLPEWRDDALPQAAVNLYDLLDGWWAEAKTVGRADGTYRAYKYAIKRFVEHLGHEDASRVTQQDVLDYKAARLTSGASPSTVKSLDMGSLRTVFGWAVDNKKLAANPAEGIKVASIKKVKTRSKGFTPEEAAAILSHSLTEAGNRKERVTKLRYRWAPWLCAYTGARIGEIMQLRKQDVTKRGGHWTILITPEAGTVKNKEARVVVLHEHLIADGFVDMVDKAPAGYLFVNEAHQASSVGSALGQWVRKFVPDPNVSPNHGWRHLFKTIGRRSGISDHTLDVICGHAPRSVGEEYGEVEVETQAKAIAMFPRFSLTKGEK